MITLDTIGRERRSNFVQGRKIKAIARGLRPARNTVHDIVRAGPMGEATERRHVRDKQPLPHLGEFVPAQEMMLADTQPDRVRIQTLVPSQVVWELPERRSPVRAR